MYSDQFPIPGTMTADLFNHIKEHPGCSRRAAWRALGYAQSHADKSIDKLIKRGLVEATRNHLGYWELTAVEIAE